MWWFGELPPQPFAVGYALIAQGDRLLSDAAKRAVRIPVYYGSCQECDLVES